MARKPKDWRQRSLFSSGPGYLPEPHDNSIIHPQGDEHALQVDHTRPAAPTAADARSASQEPQTPADTGTLRQGAEEQPRSLEGNAPATEAGQRQEPDRQRSDGNGREGNGGSFALRVSPGRQWDGPR